VEIGKIECGIATSKTFNISLLNGYVPVPGTKFTIMKGTVNSTTNLKVNFPALPNGRTWKWEPNFDSYNNK